MSVKIFDIELDNLTKEELEAKLQSFLASKKTHLVVTPNPEMIVAAEKDSIFKQILREADLKVPDGFGLVLAAWCLLGEKLNRWPGVEVMESLVALAAEQGQSVWLLGAAPGVAHQAAERLKERWPSLKIGVSSEPDLEQIKKARPAVLLVALGHGQQEKWLANNLPELSSVRVGMGVGGSFDFIAGRVRRAPLWLRQVGLEWLWRLSQEPRRLPRIFRAVITFPILVVFHQLQLFLPHRQAVAGFILTRSGQFAIFKRCAEKDYWQTPQGGVNPGESPEEAVLREVGEEIGNSNLKILFKAKERYRYDWPARLALKKRWRGQEQVIFLLFLDDDPKNIKCDYRELCGYKLVAPEESLKSLHPVRCPAFRILLKETGGLKKFMVIV